MPVARSIAPPARASPGGLGATWRTPKASSACVVALRDQEIIKFKSNIETIYGCDEREGYIYGWLRRVTCRSPAWVLRKVPGGDEGRVSFFLFCRKNSRMRLAKGFFLPFFVAKMGGYALPSGHRRASGGPPAGIGRRFSTTCK